MEWCLWECKDLQRKDQESSWPNDYKKGVSCWRQSPLSFTFETFFGKLPSRWIGPFVVSNVFSYGAVEITSLETNKVLKVNEHWLKTFYKGWTIELTASVELAKPIYTIWACDVSSQWHKTKALIRRQPNKKIRIASFFPYLFFFCILLYFCYSPIFLFFYFNIEDNVVFKVWGY
jgi:hypothetical protein